MASSESFWQPVALRWMLSGEWRAHPARVVVAACAIAIGVALGFAVHLVNQSALNEFGHAMRSVNGAADLQIHATSPAGFDEQLYPLMAHASGILHASPVVELTAKLGDARLTLLGLDPLRAAQVTPSLLGRPTDGGEAEHLFDQDAVFLSAAALASSGAHIADSLTLTAAGRSARFHLRGTLPGVAAGQAVAVVDIAAAQWRFGQLGKIQRIDLRLTEGIDREKFRAGLAGTLPADAVLLSEDSEVKRGDSLSRAYRVNLDMLAMVALLTGGFLVYSAQSLSVARRQGQFALLRVLGLRRRALLTQIIVEGAVVGVIGAVLGIGLGTLLAKVALSLLGGDLGGGYFSGSQPQLVFPRMAALTLLLLGLVVAIAGSVLPALAAGRSQPAVALKNSGESGDPRVRPKGWLGLTLLLAGGLAALAPPLFDLPLFGYAAIALMLAGGVALMAPLARLLLTPLQRFVTAGPAVDLAIKRLWGAPGQAAIALSGIVASTSLTIAMAVMVSSFRGSVDDWLTQLLPSDLYLRLESADGGGFDADQQQSLAQVAGVARIEFRKSVALRLTADQPAVALIVRPIDPADPAHSLPMIGSNRAVPVGETAVWISEPMKWFYHLAPGEQLSLPLGGAARTLFIAGVWRDYGRQHGAVALDSADYTRLSGDQTRSEAAIDLRPAAEVDQVIAGLRGALPPDLANQTDIGQPREIRAMALKIFDRSFAVTYALEAIAVLVGLTGVAATLSAQTLARSREFGMLRHIGVRRRQVITMLVAEGALLGALGVVAGSLLGLAMSQVLIHVINPQSFHWTMETRLPWLLFVILSIALILAAAATAVLAGQRALSVDALRAVREDW
jgi:putative ABC transport system permease protein